MPSKKMHSPQGKIKSLQETYPMTKGKNFPAYMKEE